MNVRVINNENGNIAVISSDEVMINNGQDALDLIGTVGYNYNCNKIIINKKDITEDFFSLANGIAGEIMQKVITYGVSLAIVGAYDQYNSKSLKSLIYESNKGNRILFKSTEEEALESFGIK